MRDSLEDLSKSKRQLKRAVIVFAVVEFIAIVFAVVHVTHR